MLTQRLQQHGVITDLTKVGASDIESMAKQAELCKQQSQMAVVYARAAKSALKSMGKTLKTQADLYKDANQQLKAMDSHRLNMLKSELDYETHMVASQAKSQSEQALAQAKQKSVAEVEQAKLNGRLIALGIKHRQQLQAARGKRKGLLGGIF